MAESKIVLYHLQDSRSQRILWLLEELEIPYELKKYQRKSSGMAPKELAAVYHFGTAPIITDGSITLGESGAIVEYLISKYGNGKAQPPESGKVDNIFFTHYCEGSLMPVLVNRLIFTLIPENSPWLLRPLLRFIFGKVQTGFIVPRMKMHAQFIEEHLSKCGDWFAGGSEPTSADFMMSFSLEAWASEDKTLGPHIVSYVKRVHERPAYKRALEKGGEYKYANI